MYRWIMYVHVLAGFIFMISHGASMFVAFELKRQRELKRIRALLDVSNISWAAFMLSFLVLFFAGITLAFMGRWWLHGWVWASILILLAISVFMTLIQRAHYNRLRQAVGQPYMQGSQTMPAGEPASPDEIQAVLSLGRPWLLSLIGLGGWGTILWLMMFKPF